MKYLALGAFLISTAVLSAQARAAQPGDDEDWDTPSGKAAPKAKSSGKKAAPAVAATSDGSDTDADEAAPKTAPKAAKAPAAEEAQEAEVEEAAAPVEEIQPSPTSRPPIYGKRSDWFIEPYGYARFDAIEDSTQSFEDGIQPNLIQRAGTYRGDHRRTIFTARDSRLGVYVGAPTFRGMKSMGQVELDFYGIVPTDARRHDSVVFGPLRIRLAYLKLETSIVDIYAGQYYDLFGWNGSFYPMTVGYLGVPAEIYHRNPQLRIEKKIRAGQVEITAAVAAVRPGERDSGVPEGQAGLKLAYYGVTGPSTPGFGRASLSPLSLGVSGIYRRFETPLFRAEPGSADTKTQGYGFAAQLLAPIIPARTLERKGNSLTLTGEFSIGTGIADMYTFMDGGSRFPLLPDPRNIPPAVQWPANVDPGLVTFDRNLQLKTINWAAFVAGAQYYLPIDNGRVWLCGLYSRIWSNNIKDLTPSPSWGGVFTKMEYFDANLGIDITPAVVLGLSFQSVKQTFADESPDVPIFGTIVPTPPLPPVPIENELTGGVLAKARNDRFQLSMSLFF
jgi:hypothetical protein